MATTKRNAPVTAARQILDRRLYAGRPDRMEQREQTAREMALGMKLRRLREEAGLSQKQLAQRIKTQPSAISRIEDADYDGHSVGLLQRVAEALDMRLIIDFEQRPARPQLRNAKLK